MKVRLVDLQAEYEEIGDQIQAAIREVARTGRFILGPAVEDFEAAYQRLLAAGVEFVTEPRDEDYGRVAVFRDIAGNKWDLLGPG